MRLSSLAKALKAKKLPDTDTEINGIEYDSRKIKEGNFFVCISGFKTDGHLFAENAKNKGAAALVVERAIDIDLPQIVVENSRRALAYMSAEFYGNPAKEMKMYGVTGTKGKTTTVFMIKTVLECSGINTGLIGTIANMAGQHEIGYGMTTPESRELHELFRTIRDEGCTATVMEVSSHALSQYRVDGIQFDVGVFTNLTQDHLDYHKTMEAYAGEKKKLFRQSGSAVFNSDSEYSAFMSEGFTNKKLFFGLSGGEDVTAEDIVYHQDRVEYTLCTDWGKRRLSVAIPGKFTVYNSMACAGACLISGIGLDNVAEGLEKVKTVTGRIEVVPLDYREFTVLIDYAHSPDSLLNVLTTVKGFAKGRIITVFGCGGDRDRTKRPIMGRIAGENSDYCIVTSDNPRTEDPGKIIEDILPGVKMSGCEFTAIENRREAIRHALVYADKGDVIVLAGKGHEQYQEINGVRYPLDERKIVYELVEQIGR